MNVQQTLVEIGDIGFGSRVLFLSESHDIAMNYVIGLLEEDKQLFLRDIQDEIEEGYTTAEDARPFLPYIKHDSHRYSDFWTRNGSEQMGTDFIAIQKFVNGHPFENHAGAVLNADSSNTAPTENLIIARPGFKGGRYNF